MDWGFVLGLVGITLVVVGLVIFFGLKLNKAVESHASEINLPLNITLTGSVLFACMVAFWVYCAATRVLDPGSSLGVFLADADGVAAVVAGSVLLGGIAGAILKKLGYPIAKRGDS